MSYQVLLGNCIPLMAAMEDRSVDVVITDPPYGDHVHAKSRRGATLADREQFGACTNRVRELGFDALTLEQMDATAEQFARLARRWVLVFSNIEYAGDWRRALERHGLDYVRTGVWVKLNATPQFTGDRPGAGFEVVTIAHPKGRKRWNGGGKQAVWTHPIVINRGGREPRLHTTQKPLSLMGELVSLFTEPSETVLDAYAGSGTTGAACLELGRKFIGFEADPNYHAVATRRLEAAAAQLSLFEVVT